MNKALFLDRDGIINVDHGYVISPQSFEFVEGIFDLCRYALDRGYKLIVITNQSGIARGMYTERDFATLTLWMKQQLAKQDVVITDVYYCPHHPTKGIGDYLKVCSCRKPAPGLIYNASDKHNIDLSQSIFIGDKISDMQAAEAAGIPCRILLDSQYIDGQPIVAHRIDDISQSIQYIE